MFKQSPLFISGQGGYHTYRIPALLATARGTLLAFCEGRRHSRSDSGEIDILLRRSADGGESWSAPQLVASGGGDTMGNPAPVLDRDTGVIWLPLTFNRADGPESMIMEGRAPRTVFLTHSADDGRTWAPVSEITAQVKRPDMAWYATGPGHGIQLRSGRLLIPCDHTLGLGRDHARLGYAHVIYSDDHGATWQLGGRAQAGTNECMAVETMNGAVYLNCRNYVGDKRRAYAWSRDGGLSFPETGWDEQLIEPICQASIIRHSTGGVIFANPASTARERFTVRLSRDECRTWSAGRLLHPGPAAYSDLAVRGDGAICCLYERGEASPYETLTLARFDLDWLMG
jgi:sialidase-1